MMKNKEDIIVYVDMDNVMCDFQSAYDKAKLRNADIKYPQSQYGFFLNLEPLKDAIVSYKTLERYFDVRILTSPSVENPMSYTEKRAWVGKYLGISAARKAILAPDKSVVMGDYLIDDYDFSERSKQQDFKGTLIHFASEKYPDWKSVMTYFRNEYNINI